MEMKDLYSLLIKRFKIIIGRTVYRENPKYILTFQNFHENFSNIIADKIVSRKLFYDIIIKILFPINRGSRFSLLETFFSKFEKVLSFRDFQIHLFNRAAYSLCVDETIDKIRSYTKSIMVKNSEMIASSVEDECWPDYEKDDDCEKFVDEDDDDSEKFDE